MNIWKKFGNPFRGLEKYYEVSSLGRVKALKRELQVSWRNIVKTITFKEHLLTPSTDACGYQHVVIGKPQHKGSLWKVHQLVWYTFHPEYDRKKCGKKVIIHHKDHNKKNNTLDNLELISVLEHRRAHTKDYWEKHPQGTKRLVYGKKPTKYALALMRGDKQQ